MDLDKAIFDILLDQENIPLSYNKIYNMLKDRHIINNSQESVDLFFDTIDTIPSKYHNIHHIYLHPNIYTQEPALVFTNELKCEDSYLSNEVKFTEYNCEYLFNLAKSKNVKMMEHFLNLYPKCLYWRNSKGDTIMDVACDNDDHNMQNLIAGTLVRDKLNEKDDEILKYQDKIVELQQMLIWRTSAGIIFSIFMAFFGYFIGFVLLD
jgi:hypothetical protein